MYWYESKQRLSKFQTNLAKKKQKGKIAEIDRSNCKQKKILQAWEKYVTHYLIDYFIQNRRNLISRFKDLLIGGSGDKKLFSIMKILCTVTFFKIDHTRWYGETAIWTIRAWTFTT